MSHPASFPASPKPPMSGTAVASLVLGVCAIVIFCSGPLFGIPAIICGHVSLSHLKRFPQKGGKGLAIAGLFLGYLSIAIAVFTFGIGAFFVSEGEKLEQKRIAKLELVAPEEAEFPVILPKDHDPSKPVPVAVWLHGYGWNPSELTLFQEDYQKRADDLGIAFVGISGTAERDEGGYEWAEDAEIDYKYIESVFKVNSDKVTPDWPRVALFGFSQGAKVAGDVASCYPKKFAGAILMSPGGQKSYTDVPTVGEEDHKWQNYYCFVGQDEAYGNVSLTNSYAADLKRLGAKVISKQYEGVEDHSTPPDYEEKLSEWIELILSVEVEADPEAQN